MLQISVVDVVLHFLQCLFADSWFQLTFPNGHYPPAHFLQLRFVAFVPLLVPFDLLLPEIRVAVWNMAVHLMAVPKTAVNEDHNSVFAQYNIGRARQLLHVLAIAVAPVVQVAADDKFCLVSLLLILAMTAERFFLFQISIPMRLCCKFTNSKGKHERI